jgi:hypothetical protein
MEVTASAEVPVLVSVTVLVVLVVFTTWFPNETEVGDRKTAGAVPVPVRVTVCGLPPALSMTERVPPRLPIALGVNVMLIVQALLAANVAGEIGQLFVCAKSLALLPVNVSAVTVRADVPVLVSVTVCAELVVVTSWFPNEAEPGESDTAGAVPVPVRVIV